MLKYLDRTLAVLLLLGGMGHTLGSFKVYASDPMTLLWALCASLFITLLAVLNFLRSYRHGDRALAWITGFGNGCWIAVSVVFGVLIGNSLDPRAVVFVLISAGLLAFSVRDSLVEGSMLVAQ
jgi:hypothetical protein